MVALLLTTEATKNENMLGIFLIFVNICSAVAGIFGLLASIYLLAAKIRSIHLQV